MKRKSWRDSVLKYRWVSAGVHIHPIRGYRWRRLDCSVCRRDDQQSPNDASIDESGEKRGCNKTGHSARPGSAMRALMGRFWGMSLIAAFRAVKLIIRALCR